MKKHKPTIRLLILIPVVFAALVAGYVLHRKWYRFGQRVSYDAAILQQGEALAKKHCSGCHLFPAPSAHTPRIWNYILVQMGFKLGVNTFDSHGYFREDQSALQAEHNRFLKNPPLAALSLNEYRQIKNFYLAQSEMQFISARTDFPATLPLKELVPLRLPQSGAFATTAATVSRDGDLWLGEGLSRRLFRFRSNGELRATYPIADMPVSLHVKADSLTITYIGSMLPSDEKKGSIVEYQITADSLKPGRRLARDLFRTSHSQLIAETAELDIAEFGDTLGEFKVVSLQTGGEQILYSGSGPIWSQRVTLFGSVPQLLLLVAQEKEELILFEKTGNRWSKRGTLLRFSPESGAMHFVVQDMNGDGRPDIVLINGDDGDLPGEAARSYHGVRVFFQTPEHRFNEGFFFNFPGAYRSCVADFNRDGLTDIVAVSYYPQAGEFLFSVVMLLQQRDGGWLPWRIDTGKADKFIGVTCEDVDRDGKTDILLTAGKLDIDKAKNAAGVTIGYFVKNPF